MKGILFFTLVLGLCYKTEATTTATTTAATTTAPTTATTTPAPTTSTTTTAPTTSTTTTAATTTPAAITKATTTTPAAITKATTITTAAITKAPTSTTTAPTTPASKAPTSTTTASTTPASKATTTTTAETLTTKATTTTSTAPPTTKAPSSSVTTSATTITAPSSSVTTSATTITGPDGSSTNASTPDSFPTSATTKAISPVSGTTNQTSETNSPGSDSTETATASSQGPDSGTSVPPSTQPAKTCKADPCGKSGATCTDILGGYICQCPFSYYYDETSSACTQGKQFFGTVQLNQTYSLNFQNTEHAEYKILYDKVQTFFKNCFKNLSGERRQTVIVKISPSPPKARSSKAATGQATLIEVNNIFRTDSTINETLVKQSIEEGRNADPSFTSYTNETACSISVYCDTATTDCKENPGFQNPTCTCKPNFYYTGSLEITSCSECNPDCTSENSKQCVQIKTNLGAVPECQCLANFEYDKDNKTCVSCSFGYSGEGCKDNFQLILVIVGSISGALVLALLGGVIGLSVKSKRNNKYSDRQRLIDHEDNPGFGSAVSMDGNHFPRVKVKQAVNGTKPASNPYDATDPFQVSVPARDYDDDNDSWYEMALKDNRSGKPSSY